MIFVDTPFFELREWACCLFDAEFFSLFVVELLLAGLLFDFIELLNEGQCGICAVFVIAFGLEEFGIRYTIRGFSDHLSALRSYRPS